jgi:hypothetical protein
MSKIFIKAKELEKESAEYSKSVAVVNKVKYETPATKGVSLSGIKKLESFQVDFEKLKKSFIELSEIDAKNLLYIKNDWLAIDRETTKLFDIMSDKK